MNAVETQHILARLYTDQDYRKFFLNEREQFYKSNHLVNPDTIAFLEAIKPDQLEFFSKSLYHKRYHETLQIIPGTSWLLKNHISHLFNAFHKTYKPSGIHKHYEEALAFMTFLKETEIDSPMVQTILKFESKRIRQFTSPSNWKIAFFSYNPVLFLNALQAGQEPIIKKGLTCILFKKGKIHYLYQI